MSEAIITAVLSLIGTVVGAGFGVVTSSKLINFRLNNLESSIKECNDMIHQVYELEARQTLLEEELTLYTKKKE